MERHRKSVKSSSKVQMVDASTETEKYYLDMFHIPVKSEASSPSQEFDEVKNSDNTRCAGKRQIDFHVQPLKIKTEKEEDAERFRRKRGRPNKNKGSNKRPLMCGLCDFKTESFREQKIHLKTHSHQNVYECCHCKSTFSQKGNLITHIRTHTKEKPFKCKICDFAATQKINLQVHIRIHTKEKPFKCCYCNFSTAQKCNLLAHITRIHSDVKVVKALETCGTKKRNVDSQFKFYRCSLCRFSSRLKREIVDHMKLQHQFFGGKYQTRSFKANG